MSKKIRIVENGKLKEVTEKPLRKKLKAERDPALRKKISDIILKKEKEDGR